MSKFIKRVKTDTNEYIAYKLLAPILLYNAYIGVSRFFTYKIVHISTLGTLFYLGIIIIGIIWVFVKYSNENFVKKGLKSIAVYICFISAMYLLFPINRIFFKEYANDIILNIFIGCIGAAIISELKSPKMLCDVLLPHLRFLAIALPLIYVLGASNYYTSMEWGSRMYPVGLWYFLCLNTTKCNSQFDKLLLVVSLAFSMLGGRQSLVFLVLGIAAIFIWNTKLNKKKVLIIMLIVICAMLTFLFYDDILALLKNALNKFGINSRSLTMLSNQSLFDVSNRKSIYYRCREIISSNGNHINGMFADRYYLRQYRSNIAYAHNLIYELLIDYGTIVGSLIIFIVFSKAIIMFFKTNKSNKAFYILMCIIGVARCFISSSVFIEVGVLFFIGLLENKYINGIYEKIENVQVQGDENNDY